MYSTCIIMAWSPFGFTGSVHPISLVQVHPSWYCWIIVRDQVSAQPFQRFSDLRSLQSRAQWMLSNSQHAQQRWHRRPCIHTSSTLMLDWFIKCMQATLALTVENALGNPTCSKLLWPNWSTISRLLADCQRVTHAWRWQKMHWYFLDPAVVQ